MCRMAEKPIVSILKRRKKLSRNGIIMTLGDWFNVVGAVEFDNALKEGVIIQSPDEPHLYVLNELSGCVSKSSLSTKTSKTASTVGVPCSLKKEKDNRQT